MGDVLENGTLFEVMDMEPIWSVPNTFSVEMIAELANIFPDEVDEALDELEQAGLIKYEPVAEGLINVRMNMRYRPIFGNLN